MLNLFPIMFFILFVLRYPHATLPIFLMSLTMFWWFGRLGQWYDRHR